MADAKTSALAALAGAALAGSDLFMVVDISDVTMAATGTNKRITKDELAIGLGVLTQTAADALYSALGHTHSFASLTAKPTTLVGYGITDAAPLVHTHPWSDITGEPTTIAGYGITDFNALGDARWSLLAHTHAAADIASGTIATARLGSGTADATTFLRGDQTWATPAGGGTPGGSNTQVQFNDSSAFGGDAGLTYVKATDALTVVGSVSTALFIAGLGAVGGPSYAFTSDPNTGMWSSTGDTINFSTNGSERMRIDSSGRVLIGRTTSALGTNLQVTSSAEIVRHGDNVFPPSIEFVKSRGTEGSLSDTAAGDSVGEFGFRYRTGGAYTQGAAFGGVRPSSGAGVDIYFTTNGTERARILATGALTFGASVDNGISRNAAGVLEINSGTAGTYRDLRLRDLVAEAALNVKGAAASVASGISIGGATRTTIGATGAASALPANPLGYLDWYVGSTAVAIPYYTRGA
jgi:hypothetical protein